jgi:hypothetical protein
MESTNRNKTNQLMVKNRIIEGKQSILELGSVPSAPLEKARYSSSQPPKRLTSSLCTPSMIVDSGAQCDLWRINK